MAIITKAGFETETGSDLPAVVDPEADRCGVEASARVAKSLDGEVRPTHQICVERGINLDAVEAVGNAGIEVNEMGTEAHADEVPASGKLEGFDEFEVALGALLIETVALTEGDNAGDFVHRPGRVWSK